MLRQVEIRCKLRDQLATDGSRGEPTAAARGPSCPGAKRPTRRGAWEPLDSRSGRSGVAVPARAHSATHCPCDCAPRGHLLPIVSTGHGSQAVAKTVSQVRVVAGSPRGTAARVLAVTSPVDVRRRIRASRLVVFGLGAGREIVTKRHLLLAKPAALGDTSPSLATCWGAVIHHLCRH
ncbi:unnamed protein product [Lampetra fluviatilis]